MRKFTGSVLALAVTGLLAAVPAPAMAATGVMATYQGKSINLAHSWEDAAVCAEFAAGDVRCFRTPQEFTAATGERGIGAVGDCKNTWVCLWENVDHTGRRLQWNEAGTKKLADWGFRDKASSAALHRIQGGATLVNYLTARPDQKAYLRAGGIYSDFRQFDWNDKTDELQVG
ncbi:peptidase inhibitor family I36 protein [Amycolatopsis rhabdoformis]|uniref:Peptidase inhibitor family I36 protein n=1 Tax=Amycolatopsis rhabdoformis TaxID=1448059 RepID=A0ABZ1I708_9PSEU|nr:peptidase inhibitor family I36 protein [Amycolatopsis rhabdoformis]WSE30142.1 peptidase inhibitor family I36 protein [Amycolatopsis rhabdoformis]